MVLFNLEIGEILVVVLLASAFGKEKAVARFTRVLMTSKQKRMRDGHRSTE